MNSALDFGYRSAAYVPHRMSATTLIPPPDKVSRRIKIAPTGRMCLAEQMGLRATPEKRNLYYAICETVGKLCDRYYPYQKPAPDPPQRQLMVEKAIRVHPILKTYQNNWPLVPMYTMHRQLRKSGNPTGIRQYDQLEVRSTSCPPTAGRPRSLRDRSSPRRSVMSGSRLQDSSGRKLTPKTSSRRRVSPRSKITVTPTVIASKSPSTTTRKVEKHTDFVQEFLRGLPQDLRFLYPVFVGYGICDESALRGLRRMQGWRCWLYSWVRTRQLTELQFKMISDGIAGLHGITSFI
ncbi:hypothetical protein C2E23DRAFT_87238 [Lenzites betulinus]|nr:hypothetical protein C2E23DRAFT_87238 [Lenzites betulinus]